MGLFSVAKLFGVTIRESATDGSDFTNPDADYRRLFLGEDGALHLKDSAGAVTDIGGGTPSEITDIPTAETDDTLRLAPDGAGGVEWAAGGGGGAVYPFESNYFNETKPGSANATYDDEFDDTTGMSGTTNGLNARWNWRNQGTATATFGKAGWLTLAAPASSSGNWRILEIAGFADGTYEAKISQDCSLGDNMAGIVLVDAVNGDLVVCGFVAEGDARYFGVQRWSSVTTWAANSKRTQIPTMQTRVFVRVVKASTNLELWGSHDGVGWILYRAWSDDVTATRIGLGVNELTNNGRTKLHVDYFRKTA